MKYTEEQLRALDQETVIKLLLSQQDEFEKLDKKMQLLLEQVAVLNNKRFGRSSEKLECENQIAFMEVDGKIVFFNEAEAVASLDEEGEDEEVTVRKKGKKRKGKRDEDLSGLPIEVVSHKMTEEELQEEFGDDPYYRLDDEVYRRYKFTPAKVEVEEHHVEVYASKKTDHIVKAKHPKYLLRNSLVSPSLEAAIINGKYVNAVPLYRMEKEFERYGLAITRQNMAHWTIQCAEKYLAVFYDYLHKLLYEFHVIHADETPVLVNKDGRPAGAKSYMWVYRTGFLYKDKVIVLYEYQKTRNASHPRQFLKDFEGVCITDGYEVYHTLEREKEDLRIAGCWAYSRRRYDEAYKALPKGTRRKSLAYFALKQIQAIYREEAQLKDLSPEERFRRRQLTVKPLVDAHFEWVRENKDKVLPKGKTSNGFNYTLNQEKYLRVFLEDGEVTMDNNSAEQSIRGFCIGKNYALKPVMSYNAA